MTPPTTSSILEASSWTRSEFDRPIRRRAVAYSSIAVLVCLFVVVLIVTASVVAGTIYNEIFNEIDADIARYAMTAVVMGATFVLLFRDRGLYDPNALLNRPLQVRNIIVLWAATFSLFISAVFALKVGPQFSRGAVLSFGVVGLLTLLGHHALWGIVIKAALGKGSLRGRKTILLSMHEHPEEPATDQFDFL